MKRIASPPEGQPQTEDIELRYFKNDQSGNFAVARETVQIPLNCGSFVKESMVLGFMVGFDELVSGATDENYRSFIELMTKVASDMGAAGDEVRQKRVQVAIADLERFRALIESSREKIASRKAAPQATQ